jgi:hypothetical protein
VEQDRISDAGFVDVEDGNFFGTGRAVAQGFQVALMDYSWKATEELVPAAEPVWGARNGAAGRS